MVSLDVVRASNARIKSLPSGLVALFVGGTSGIAESTAKQFCRYAAKPKIYIVGRNEEAANRIISELKDLQADGQYNFIRKDLSLLASVDEVCGAIKTKEGNLNLLFMSAGTMSLKGRDETSEGLDKKLATNYYSRMRFAQQLLPLLKSASPGLSRVVSVLAPGEESASFNTSDLGLKNTFSLKNAANHAIIMTDFAFEELAKENPTVSFVHAYPGIVKTGFSKEQNFLLRSTTAAALTLLAPWTVPINESGERHLYLSTSGRFPSQDGSSAIAHAGNERIMQGSDGKIGSGAYLIGADGEVRMNEKVLSKLRSDGARGLVWEHTMDELKRVSGRG